MVAGFVWPMSSWPSSSDSTGMISGTISATASSTGISGWRVTKPAQRPQMPSFSGSSLGCSHNGRASEPMWRPASAISAGSSVTAASTAVPTATAAV